jgi:hypothetical protein
MIQIERMELNGRRFTLKKVAKTELRGGGMLRTTVMGGGRRLAQSKKAGAWKISTPKDVCSADS